MLRLECGGMIERVTSEMAFDRESIESIMGSKLTLAP